MFINNTLIKQSIINTRPVSSTTVPIGSIINNRCFSMVNSIFLSKKIIGRILKWMATNLTKT